MLDIRYETGYNTVKKYDYYQNREVNTMMYPFMTLPDETEIVHSQILLDGDKEYIKVYMEKPSENGFNTATCYLPDYNWTDIRGFSNDEIDNLKDIVQSTAHLIFQFARDGGAVRNASNF